MGLTFASLTAAAVCLPMWLCRQWLSDVTVDANITDRARFYPLAIVALLISPVGQRIDVYLQDLNWSGVFVMISMGRLLINITLNIWSSSD